MRTAFELGFDPLLPWWLLGILAFAALAFAGRGIQTGARGTWPRLAFYVALLLALVNPSLLREAHETLADVVLVAVDRSASNHLADRQRQTEDALEAVRRRVEDTGGELRVVESRRSEARTAMFEPVSNALAEIAPDRLSAIVMITDGRIDDAQQAGAVRALGQPVHGLLTGEPDMPDRRINILRAPEFGLVDRPVTVELEVVERNIEAGQAIPLTIRRLGKAPETRTVRAGEPVEITVIPERRGTFLLDVAAGPAEGEGILVNNRALFSINAVRDRLRVLLVSGEPHPGERVWRDSLKSDPAVDLIHFTILRLPTSQDVTPVGQLSLIPFPTERLFAEQLADFDLVIFDRYSLRGVLELRYFDNLLSYVEAGGAVFVANGPEYAGGQSLHLTPLAEILPASPTGDILEQGFRPALTETGRRHPVTEALARGLGDDGRQWGRWFRMLDSDLERGHILLTGAQGRPLLVLSRAREGRVAQLMSDHVWLWARGVEGGGPYRELLRRTVHWLMKEPDLEEEALTARSEGGEIVIERRSLGDAAGRATLVGPGGAEQTVELTPAAEGIARARVEAAEFGLYRVSADSMEAVAGVGPVGTHELSEIVPSEALLGPIAEETGGGLYWLHDGMPEIRRPAERASAAGRGWLGLPRRDASRIDAVEEAPLFDPWIWLVILGGLLGLAWWRESA